MFTTYLAFTVITHTGSYWAGFVVALLAGLLLGGLIERRGDPPGRKQAAT